MDQLTLLTPGQHASLPADLRIKATVNQSRNQHLGYAVH